MLARLSIVGINNWTDGQVWDLFQVPEGVSLQDAEDYIMSECAELSLCYVDPDYIKYRIGLWSRKQLPGWERIFRALTEDYDPLHNYDRYENWDEAGKASATGSNKTSVAGFNQAAGLADRDRTDQDTSSESSGTRKGHTYGNIGVTTSMQMLTQEVEGRVRFTMLDVILESFKQEFCIQIY